MDPNLAKWDRVLRYIMGLIMLTWALSGGPKWAYIGLYLLASASWGVCPMYVLFRVSTR